MPHCHRAKSAHGFVACPLLGTSIVANLRVAIDLALGVLKTALLLVGLSLYEEVRAYYMFVLFFIVVSCDLLPTCGTLLLMEQIRWKRSVAVWLDLKTISHKTTHCFQIVPNSSQLISI